VWFIDYPAPFGGGNTRSVLGIYDHVPPAGSGIQSAGIGNSWSAKVGEFATSYALKSAIWLKGLGLLAP
jgi:hypothetical protein